jgi:hypothetical protein
MSDIYSFDPSAGNNNAAPPNGFPENMEYYQVNDAARELMAAVARWRNAAFSGIVTGGSSTAYTLASGQTLGAYADGMSFTFVAHATSTGAATLNVDSLGAVALLDARGNPLGASDIVLNGVYRVVKRGAGWRVLGALTAASVAALNRVNQAYTTGGTGNAYTVTTGLFTTPYVNGSILAFVADRANTGAATINVDGIGAEALQDPDGAALVANDLIVNEVVIACRVAGAWRCFAGLPVNLTSQVSGVLPLANGGTGQNTLTLAAQALAQGGAGFGTEAVIASAATVDIGTAGSHSVSITGTTTITSFGSSASTAAPIYLVKFAGAVTVTHSATLVLPGLVNYVTSAGDAMLAEFIGPGDWRVRAILPRTPIGSLPNNADPDQTLSQIEIRNSSTGAMERTTLSTLIAYEHIQTQTASASATLDFALPTTEGFTHFEFILSGIVPSTDTTDFIMRYSTDGGTTYNAGASDYAYGLSLSGNPATAELMLNNTVAIKIADSLGTAAGEFVSGRVRLFDPFNASIRKFAEVASQAFSSNVGEIVNLTGGGGFRANNNALTHVRFLALAGNIASGSISMYGIRTG